MHSMCHQETAEGGGGGGSMGVGGKFVIQKSCVGSLRKLSKQAAIYRKILI